MNLHKVLIYVFIIFIMFSNDDTKSDIKIQNNTLPLCDEIAFKLDLIAENLFKIESISFEDSKDWDNCIGALYIENYFQKLVGYSSDPLPHKYKANIAVISEFSDGLPNGEAFAVIREEKKTDTKNKETEIEINLSEMDKLMSMLTIDSTEFVGIYNGNLKNGLPHGKGELIYRDVRFAGTDQPTIINGNWKAGCLDWDMEQNIDGPYVSENYKKNGNNIVITYNSFIEALFIEIDQDEYSEEFSDDSLIDIWKDNIEESCIPGLKKTKFSKDVFGEYLK